MRRIVAIDWDQREIRYVLASVRGREVTVRAIGSQSLVDVGEGSEAPRPDLEGSLRALLSDPMFSGARIILAVERSRIELLHLQLPPATDEELPELVLHQAVRELQQPPENLIVDFVPLEGDTRSRRKVMAAVLLREEFQRIISVLRRMKLKPAHMVFRPLAAASIVVRMFPSLREPVLVVNRVGAEADLSVIAEGRAIFSRTVRLPEASPTTQLARLVLEAERTVTVAATEYVGPDQIARAFVLGLAGEENQLVERLAEQLGVPVQIIDPFNSVNLDQITLPENAGRFAVHIGMILDEVWGARPPIDFLNVRRPPSRLKKSQIIGVGVGILALVSGLLLWNFWRQYSEVAEENAALAAELQQLEQAAKKAAQQGRLVRAVAEWANSEIVWLDELADLSLRLPSARHLVLSRFTASCGTKGGNIFLQGYVRDPRILQQMEYSIRDPYRRIQTPRIFEREMGGETAWSFESSVVVQRRQPGEYLLSGLGRKQQLFAEDASSEPKSVASSVEVTADSGK